MVLGRSFLVAAVTTDHGRIHHYCSLLQISFPTRFQKGTQMVHMNDAWSPESPGDRMGRPLGCGRAAPAMSTQLQFGILCDAKHSTRKTCPYMLKDACFFHFGNTRISHGPCLRSFWPRGKRHGQFNHSTRGLLKTSSALQRELEPTFPSTPHLTSKTNSRPRLSVFHFFLTLLDKDNQMR